MSEKSASEAAETYQTMQPINMKMVQAHELETLASVRKQGDVLFSRMVQQNDVLFAKLTEKADRYDSIVSEVFARIANNHVTADANIGADIAEDPEDNEVKGK